MCGRPGRLGAAWLGGAPAGVDDGADVLEPAPVPAGAPGAPVSTGVSGVGSAGAGVVEPGAGSPAAGPGVVVGPGVVQSVIVSPSAAFWAAAGG